MVFISHQPTLFSSEDKLSEPAQLNSHLESNHCHRCHGINHLDALSSSKTCQNWFNIHLDDSVNSSKANWWSAHVRRQMIWVMWKERIAFDYNNTRVLNIKGEDMTEDKCTWSQETAT